MLAGGVTRGRKDEVTNQLLIMEDSNIEWTDDTFNPWIGCTKVSPGCANCYAAEQNKLRKWVGNGEWNGQRRLTSDANWRKPLQWNKEAENTGKRRRVFCASLADWLDDQVPVHWLARLLSLIHHTPNLDWLLLTKRPQNWMPRLIEASQCVGVIDNIVLPWLNGTGPANVWVGTTAEDQMRADERIPDLLTIPARVRFLSVEPMLGPVDIRGIGGIHWVICGGESGPHFRPLEIEWMQNLSDQCPAGWIAFFGKQDSHRQPGQRGRIPDALWNRKEFPILH